MVPAACSPTSRCTSPCTSWKRAAAGQECNDQQGVSLRDHSFLCCCMTLRALRLRHRMQCSLISCCTVFVLRPARRHHTFMLGCNSLLPGRVERDANSLTLKLVLKTALLCSSRQILKQSSLILLCCFDFTSTTRKMAWQDNRQSCAERAVF